MIGMTVCSGIGAPEVAAPWIDWRFASEIQPFPRAVLQERFDYRAPADHNQGDPLLWSDMTEVTPDLLRDHGVPLPDLVFAGTPCQSFSVAGLRGGLNDDRGNLTLKFVEMLHAIVDARHDGKLIAIWENVPGVLSDKTNAFGCFLAGIVGADHPLCTPDGESWPGVGMVAGPRARATWRVCDAQYFGVPQRRRRVFVVIDFGNRIDPAAILFERKGMSGHPAPSHEAGQDVTGTLSARTQGGGGLGTDFDLDGGLRVQANSGDVAYCLAASAQQSLDAETETLLAISATGVHTHSLTAEGHDASEDGTGRGAPVVAFDCKGTQVQQAVAFAQNQRGELRTSDVAPQLTCGGEKPGQGYPALMEGVSAFDLRGRKGGAMPEGPHDTANMRAASGGSSRSYIQSGPVVRRLTPTECHRLQGFPDDHCAITYRGKPAADGPQYKALGNSMAVPVVKWILDRVRAAE